MVLPSRLHRHRHLLVSPRSNFCGTQRKLAQLGASLHNTKHFCCTGRVSVSSPYHKRYKSTGTKCSHRDAFHSILFKDFFPRKTEWSWYSIEYVTSSAPGYIWRTSVWKNSHAATNYLNIINNTPNDQKFPIFFGRNIFISTKLVLRCHFMA